MGDAIPHICMWIWAGFELVYKNCIDDIDKLNYDYWGLSSHPGGSLGTFYDEKSGILFFAGWCFYDILCILIIIFKYSQRYVIILNLFDLNKSLIILI